MDFTQQFDYTVLKPSSLQWFMYSMCCLSAHLGRHRDSHRSGLAFVEERIETAAWTAKSCQKNLSDHMRADTALALCSDEIRKVIIMFGRED